MGSGSPACSPHAGLATVTIGRTDSAVLGQATEGCSGWHALAVVTSDRWAVLLPAATALSPSGAISKAAAAHSWSFLSEYTAYTAPSSVTIVVRRDCPAISLSKSSQLRSNAST
jgi:hypothetical protein